MKLLTELSLIKDRYPDAINEIMKKLHGGSSINNTARKNKLKWEFIYGHNLEFSFFDIAAGNVARSANPNDIPDAKGRAEAWIKRINAVGLKGSIGHWYCYAQVNDIPQEVRDYELKCAEQAVLRETSGLKLGKKDLDTLIKDGLILNK